MKLEPAAIAGITEWKPERVWTRPMFGMEAMAQLARELLDDTGIEKDEVDGLVIGGTMESPMFAPSAVAEYLNVRSNFNEVVDLGGATSAGMISARSGGLSPPKISGSSLSITTGTRRRKDSLPSACMREPGTGTG